MREENFTRVYLASDGDGHNFIIPFFMREDFIRLTSGLENPDGTVNYDGLDEFNLKFEIYKCEEFSNEPIYVHNNWLQSRGE